MTSHINAGAGLVVRWRGLLRAWIAVGLLALLVLPAAVQADDKLFCSHPAPGVKYIGTFTKTGASQAKIVDATTILNTVITKVSEIRAWEDSFHAIGRDNPQFKAVLSGVVLLYVVVFGILIVFNMVNLTWYEVFIRIAKIGIVYYLIFGTGMSEVVAKFILGGMNELIEAYYDATIGAHVVTLQDPKNMLTVKPLMFLIAPMEKVMNLQFICAVLAFFFAGPAGMGLAIFLIMGIFQFFMSIVAAIATYIKAIIGLTILFSIAPIFIACLLFDQTRRLFDGWLTMCLSFALQPVFVFAFLGFFMVMLDGALKPLTNIYWCYGPMYDLTFVKINFYFPVPKEYFLSPTKVQAVEVIKSGVKRVVPLDKDYGLTVKDLWNAAGLDLYVVDVLMFTMLSSLTWRYSDYTGQIAKEIVGGGVSITSTGGQMLESLKQSGLDPRGLLERGGNGVKDLYNNVTSLGDNKVTSGVQGAAKDAGLTVKRK